MFGSFIFGLFGLFSNNQSASHICNKKRKLACKFTETLNPLMSIPGVQLLSQIV